VLSQFCNIPHVHSCNTGIVTFFLRLIGTALAEPSLVKEVPQFV